MKITPDTIFKIIITIISILFGGHEYAIHKGGDKPVSDIVSSTEPASEESLLA